MHLLFKHPLSSLWDLYLKKLSANFPTATISYTPEGKPWEKDHYNTLLKSADTIVAGNVTPEEIKKAKKLQGIFVPFAGVNQFSFNEIQQGSLWICNAHGNAKTTAERAFALAMALLGKVLFYHDELKKGYWHRSHKKEDLWVSMQDMPALILGKGHLGIALENYLKPFTTDITFFRKNPEKNQLNETNDLLKSLQNARIIFICLPLTSDTKHLFNNQNMSMLEGKYIINVGRGEIVEEESFFDFLKHKKIAGAGLDVWYQYPGKDKKEPVFPSQFPFHTLENVVLSPHKAAHCIQGVLGNIESTISNIAYFLKTGTPPATVNLDAGY